MAEGYVYLLVNSSMGDLVKVGKTVRHPQGRAAELSATTSIPTPFVVAYHAWVDDCDAAERLIHQKLAPFRENRRREFFRISATSAIDVIQSVCQDLQAPIPKLKQRRAASLAAPDRGQAPSGRSRRAERLGPVVAELRTRIRYAEDWIHFLEDIETNAHALRTLKEDFTWSTFAKAARSASTVSLVAHDQILELPRKLQEMSAACHMFRDFALRELNIHGRLSFSQVEELIYHVRGGIDNVLPELRAAYRELIAFVPEIEK